MNGTISTYAFDDLNCECTDSQDESVRQVSRLLYQIHDDTVDHPISVTLTTWDVLLRIVAFLDTDWIADKAKYNRQLAVQRRYRMEHAIGQGSMRTRKFTSYNTQIHALPVHGPATEFQHRGSWYNRFGHRVRTPCSFGSQQNNVA